ncbi:g2941 [Coccomyxa viridis]|uniref:G2941 protein n=1 Tax=Coccomyxa viridis TaxID=1274662 RepID=A0ABP1FN90_9CHLO
MVKELTKRASGLSSTLSSTSAASSGGLSTRPSRVAYDEVPEVAKNGVAVGEPGTMMIGVKLQGAERWKAWGAVALYTFLAIMQNMGNFMPAYLYEEMVVDIGMTDAQYGLIQGYAYYLVYGLSMMTAGYVTDKYRLNRVYVVAIGSGLTGAALVIEARANSFTMFLGGIVLNALTSSVVQNIPFTILSDLLPPEQLGLGGAIFGSAVYVGELFCGNVAYATILRGINWRWPVTLCGVAVTVVSAATALLIKEPPVGRFINQKKDETRSSLKDFDTKASILYLVSMSTFWILTVATGFRFMSGSIVAAYMPDYNQQLFPEETTVFAAESSIVGVCGFLAATYVGILTERLFARLPEVSLYTTSLGSIVAAAFMALAVFARFVRPDANGGYGLFLTSLAISILFSEGWIGPVTCLVTLVLPPEIKAFGVSLWSAIANMIMPAGNVLFGIYLMCGNSPTGSPGWVATARPFLLGSILFGYFVSAALFLTGARLMNRDILKLETVTKSGSLDAVAPSRVRKVGMLVGVCVVSASILILIAMSFIFSYDPQLVVHGYRG